MHQRSETLRSRFQNIVGVTGSSGHGKTSLVAALRRYGTDLRVSGAGTDRVCGICYSYFRVNEREIGLADLPGRDPQSSVTMTGLAGADLALLTIAADEGVTGQTRSLISILDLLELPRMIVAISKSDLVSDGRLAELGREIRKELHGTAIAAGPIIATSAKTGEGLDRLTATICEFGIGDAVRDARLPFRLSIDRVFSLPGGETTVTGRVLAGELRKGDCVTLSPEGLEVGVLSIHRNGRKASSAQAGDRCGLVIAGTGVSTRTVRRGHAMMAAELHAPSRRFDMSFRPAKDADPVPCNGIPVKVHCQAGEVAGRLTRDQSTHAGAGFARLVLDTPIAAFAGDRILIRHLRDSRLLGAGRVLDIPSARRRQRPGERERRLFLLSGLDPVTALTAYLGDTGGWVDCHAWFRAHGWGRADAEQAVKRLNLTVLDTGRLQAVLHPNDWELLAGEILSKLDRVHVERQDLPGLGLEKLRRSISFRMPGPVFNAAIDRLERQGCARRHGSWLRRPWFRALLPAETCAILADIAPLMAGLDGRLPPRVRDLARMAGMPVDTLRRALRAAALRGDVDEIARDHFLLRATVLHLADIARALAAATPDGFTVRTFCDRTGTSRKVAIAVLEYLDAKEVTRRDGNLRRVSDR